MPDIIYHSMKALFFFFYVCLSVHLLKRPTTANSSTGDIQVNIKTRWEMLEKEIIASGLCDGELLRSYCSVYCGNTSLKFRLLIMNKIFSFRHYCGQSIYQYVDLLCVHTMGWRTYKSSWRHPQDRDFSGLSEKERATISRGTHNIDEDTILSVLQSKMVCYQQFP